MPMETPTTGLRLIILYHVVLALLCLTFGAWSWLEGDLEVPLLMVLIALFVVSLLIAYGLWRRVNFVRWIVIIFTGLEFVGILVDTIVAGSEVLFADAGLLAGILALFNLGLLVLFGAIIAHLASERVKREFGLVDQAEGT